MTAIKTLLPSPPARFGMNLHFGLGASSGAEGWALFCTVVGRVTANRQYVHMSVKLGQSLPVVC